MGVERVKIVREYRKAVIGKILRRDWWVYSWFF
jgi:hypothetical protein